MLTGIMLFVYLIVSGVPIRYYWSSVFYFFPVDSNLQLMSDPLHYLVLGLVFMMFFCVERRFHVFS